MVGGLMTRSGRALAILFAVLLALGILPGLVSPARSAAQSSYLTQREFRDLVRDAQADDPIYGPEDGELELDQERVTFASADVELSDFLATVTFGNPYAGTRTQFDYGIQFRAHEDSGEFRYLRFIVISDGTWGLTDGTDEILETGNYDQLDDSRRGENSLTVYADGDIVHLGINGDYLTSLEVPFTDEGELSVGASFLSDSFEEGAIADYLEFTVWELAGGFGSIKQTPTPEDEVPTLEPIQGFEYESPTYGYSLAYDDSWEITTEEVDGDTDVLELQGERSSLQFLGYPAAESPVECIDGIISGLANDTSVDRVDLALDENDEELRGEQEGEAFAVVFITYASNDGPVDFTAYYSCRAIVDGESILQITHLAFSADYNGEIENRAAVLDTLDIGNGASGPGSGGVDEPTPEGTASDLPAGSLTVFLDPVEPNGPTVFGTLIPDGDRTTVSIIVLPMDTGGGYDVSINSGSCDDPGAAVFEVGAVDDTGFLEAVVDASVEELSIGDLIMLLSASGDPDAITACGALIPIGVEG